MRGLSGVNGPFPSHCPFLENGENDLIGYNVYIQGCHGFDNSFLCLSFRLNIGSLSLCGGLMFGVCTHDRQIGTPR